MCDISLALTAVSIASTVAGGVVSYMGQSQAAQEQEAYQEQLKQDQLKYRYDVAVESNKAFIDQTYQENLHLQQEAEASSNETIQRSQEAEQLRAKSRVSAGEAGVSGLSIDALTADYYRQEAFNLQNIQTNQNYLLKQSEQNKKAMRSEATSRVSGIREYIPAPVQKPSALAAGIDIVGGVAGQLGTSYYNRKSSQSRQQGSTYGQSKPTY